MACGPLFWNECTFCTNSSIGRIRNGLSVKCKKFISFKYSVPFFKTRRKNKKKIPSCVHFSLSLQCFCSTRSNACWYLHQCLKKIRTTRVSHELLVIHASDEIEIYAIFSGVFNPIFGFAFWRFIGLSLNENTKENWMKMSRTSNDTEALVKMSCTLWSCTAIVSNCCWKMLSHQPGLWFTQVMSCLKMQGDCCRV